VRSQYGEAVFTLHHRFYLHLDEGNRLWLSAEDGCEGTPVPTPTGDDSSDMITFVVGVYTVSIIQ
jgi:hypothetical protein